MSIVEMEIVLEFALKLSPLVTHGLVLVKDLI